MRHILGQKWSVPLCVPGITNNAAVWALGAQHHLLFRIVYSYIIHHILLIPSLFSSTSSPWLQACASFLPERSDSLPSNGPPSAGFSSHPTLLSHSHSLLLQTLLAPACPLGLTSIGHWKLLTGALLWFAPFRSGCCQCLLALAIPVYPDPPRSIYQDILSASVDTAECLASASCRLEMPHLLGSTLGLDQWALVHKYTSIFSSARITLRHVPHFLLEVPSRTEPKLPSVVISITG